MRTAPPIDHADEEYTLPSVEALLAGTLALMTGYAQSAGECPHRPRMAGKLVANLCQLSRHPQLSTPMQAMLANLRTRWQLEVENALAKEEPPDPAPIWHLTPTRLQ
jgi:hypothetical protein